MPRIFRDHIEPRWITNTTCFWYRNVNPGDRREFVLVDTRSGIRAPAFDHAAVARQMGSSVAADRLPVDSLVFGTDTNTVQLVGPRQTWQLDRSTSQLSAVPSPSLNEDTLVPLDRYRPSRNGGRETQITFENALDRELLLFWLDPDGRRVAYGSLRPNQPRSQHTFAGHVWLVTELDGREPIAAFAGVPQPSRAVLRANTPRPGERSSGADPRAPTGPVKSPDRRLEAFVRDHQLWLRHLDHGQEVQLTQDATPTNSYRRNVTRERAIGMNYDLPDPPETTPEVYWAPDSKHLVALSTIPVQEPRVYLVESSPKDQLQPRLLSYPYLKPGDPIPQQEVHLFGTDPPRQIPVDSSKFTQAWDLSRFEWSADSSRCTFLFNQRGHQVLRLLAIIPPEAPASLRGAATVQTLIEERAPTNSFIDYSQKTLMRHLEKRGLWLWMSERDGWNHLYAFNDRTGALFAQLTHGPWVVHSLERVSEDQSTLWFWTMGLRSDQDPYYKQLCRLDIPPEPSNPAKQPRILTEGDGDHAVQWSPDQQHFIDTWSRVDAPPAHVLRRSDDGALVTPLEQADASEVAGGGWAFPERFVAKGRDGVTDIYGILHRPRNFDPSRHYPVIENVYAGPHGAHVPRTFRAFYRHQQELADQGFIVAQIDGMGTNWRSRQFHDVAWKNLQDAGFPDRIAWLGSAARSRPWMDLTRVGIYGGSAGGQNAMRAVLDFAGFYKAAAADCGCHDNRLDKMWWNEAWLGWPVDDAYVRSSNVEDAEKLGGALLLTVGELDKNVDPSSTYRVVDALKKAGKQFEFMLMTSAGHGAGESDFGRRLRVDFFKRHLQQAPPH